MRHTFSRIVTGTSLIALSAWWSLAYAGEVGYLDKLVLAKDNVRIAFSDVKYYSLGEVRIEDKLVNTIATYLNQAIVGTFTVDRKVDFVRIDVNLFNKDGVYIFKCSDQRYEAILPNKPVPFRVPCSDVPVAVAQEYASFRMNVSFDPGLEPAQSRRQAMRAPSPAAPRSEPRIEFSNLRSYRIGGGELLPWKSQSRVVVGTVQTDRIVGGIAITADLFDRSGVYLYTCDTQIHDRLVTRRRTNFRMDCDDIPEEVENRFHHFKVRGEALGEAS